MESRLTRGDESIKKNIPFIIEPLQKRQRCIDSFFLSFRESSGGTQRAQILSIPKFSVNYLCAINNPMSNCEEIVLTVKRASLSINS